MENLGKITVFAIIMVVGFFIQLLNTYVLLDLAKLYELKFITDFTFSQIFGLILLISLVKYTYQKEEDSSFKALTKKAFTGFVNYTVFICISWGLGILAFKIIN